MVYLNIKNAFNYSFIPTKELYEELEEAISLGEWTKGPIIVRKKGYDYIVIINDELSADMLIQLYAIKEPKEWKSILRYLYVMI